MNCLNCQKFLREAIDSVYDQTYSNWEIILWNNASNDNSAEIARSYDKKLKYYCGKKTIPLGAARNKAIEQAQGEYIAFLDCDDIWLPSKLEKQVPLFDDSDVDLVYSDVIYFNPAGNSHRFYGRRPFYVGNCFGQLLADYCIAMLTVVIRRSALERQPYWFNEQLKVCEELDLFLRLAYSGKVSMFNEPLARYRVHSESWTSRQPELFEQERELILLRFEELFPEFNRTYALQIKQLRARYAFGKARLLWISGNGAVAREILRPHIKSKRVSMLYVSSFLPPLFGRFIEKLWNVLPK